MIALFFKVEIINSYLTFAYSFSYTFSKYISKAGYPVGSNIEAEQVYVR